MPLILHWVTNKVAACAVYALIALLICPSNVSWEPKKSTYSVKVTAISEQYGGGEPIVSDSIEKPAFDANKRTALPVTQHSTGMVFAAADGSQSKISKDTGIKEETVEDLKNHLLKWQIDLVVLFYSSQDYLHRHMILICNQIAKYYADRGITSIKISRFDCLSDKEHADLCDTLKIHKLPTIYYFGYHKLRKFSRFGRNSKVVSNDVMDRLVQYYGDPLVWEQIRDWTRILRWLSTMRNWEAKLKAIIRDLLTKRH